MGSVADFVDLRREVERLRAENARLGRLLVLRGQDTTAAPEQLSAPVEPPGLVTMASPTRDKLALFADRFRARADVYAVRWDNARTGAAGWMPAVAGGWRKGMDRRGATYLPRTTEVVAAHLVGDVFMGLYPLMPGNTCHFVVADFDGPTAMLDALAYVKAARASAVPAALEAMIEEATVDTDGHEDQRAGLFAMIEEHLAVPFTTTVLGVEATVR